MASQQIAVHREGAMICQGAAPLCRQKTKDLFSTFHLPRGLIPLKDLPLVEVGFNQTTRFVWLKLQNSLEYKFKAIGKTVWYEKELTAFIEDRRMRKVTGLKSKELLLWVTVSDIFVDEQNSSKINFANPSGLFRSFPVAAFELLTEEEEK